MFKNLENRAPAIFIGGLGGSGTRVVSELLQRCGVNMGFDLNESFDDLTFTLLFKREKAYYSTSSVFEKYQDIYLRLRSGINITHNQLRLLHHLSSGERPPHSQAWLRQRLHRSMQHISDGPLNHSVWGFKEPNAQVLAHRFLANFQNVVYVHVVRNPLYMRDSRNRNQVNFWYNVSKISATTENAQTRYWVWCNEIALKNYLNFSERFIFIDIDHFCIDPRKYLNTILKCAGIETLADHNIFDFIHPIKAPSDTNIRDQYEARATQIYDQIKEISKSQFI